MLSIYCNIYKDVQTLLLKTLLYGNNFNWNQPEEDYIELVFNGKSYEFGGELCRFQSIS